jgi:hypothetical protein
VAIDVRMLPEIVEYLLVGGEPAFVVLRYDQFVWLAATMADAPDVMSVLDSGNEHAFVVLRHADFLACVVALEVTGTIDAAHYLRRHPDVRHAIEAGQVADAREHYLMQGYVERRDVRLA